MILDCLVRIQCRTGYLVSSMGMFCCVYGLSIRFFVFRYSNVTRYPRHSGTNSISVLELECFVLDGVHQVCGLRAGFTIGQMGQLPQAPTNLTKLGGPHHKENEIDLFRIVHFLNVTITGHQKVDWILISINLINFWYDQKCISCFVSCEFVCLKFS